ncbi:hypothetical protein PsorP6_000826 [Peronosclerospora sorghi]|uniref:Uncharacterized protein n=1 Tax=Peronosclerospora sorghi TaxID=230839 RepID=A0ACC0WQ88_9STRA|nr:hypothetical protein PsorP6_000826 [Peronosclerospora sorghi]
MRRLGWRAREHVPGPHHARATSLVELAHARSRPWRRAVALNEGGAVNGTRQLSLYCNHAVCVGEEAGVREVVVLLQPSG